MILKIMKNDEILKPRKKLKKIAVIVLILCLAFCLRLWLLVNTDDFHGVSNGRIIRAQLILKNDLPRGEWYSPVHPPVHLLLLMGGIKAFNNPVVISRVISLIFGVLLLLPFYYCVKFLFDEQAAVFSMLAVSLYSEHVVYSVIATSETCFHFFLFLSLFLLLSSFGKKSAKYLLSSALCLGAASLCRYEGLLFIPLFAFALKKDLKHCALFAAAALIAPVIWMFINFTYSGDPLQFINTNDFTVPLQFGWIRAQGQDMGILRKAMFWPKSLIDTLGYGVFFFGIAGIAYSLFKKERMFMALLFCFLIVVFIFRTIEEKLYVQERYAITIGLLLIPYSIFIISKIIASLRKHNLKVTGIMTLLLIASMIPSLKQRILAAPLYAPLFAKQTAAYMRENIKEGDNIILDHCGDEKYREPIKVLSGINPKQFVLMPYLVPCDGQWLADREMFFNVLKEAKVNILIYSPRGDLKDILNLEERGEQAIIGDFKFSLLYPACFETPGFKTGDESKSAGFPLETPGFPRGMQSIPGTKSSKFLQNFRGSPDELHSGKPYFIYSVERIGNEK
ncbi:MAG: glycosyltransferase family 39 protein [Candidatus Omnitrophica bacterium]|nr:glycosyltransferase family 39 protein [Candidatus Omnitrophota bacterium]